MADRASLYPVFIDETLAHVGDVAQLFMSLRLTIEP
jgi:hypothetical protein